MARPTLFVGMSYRARDSKKVTITEEPKQLTFGEKGTRLRYLGDNGVLYTKHGHAQSSAGSSCDLIMTDLEYQQMQQQPDRVKPDATQQVVKVPPEITYVTINLGKRKTPFKLDINQNGKITRVEIFSDYDAPVIQS